MNNKKVVGILVIFFFLSLSAQAKQKQPSQQQPLTADEIVAKMQVQLQLTDKQVIEVKPIIEDYLVQEQQAKLEEKQRLGRVLTGDQMFTWNFLQTPPSKDKKKHTSLF